MSNLLRKLKKNNSYYIIDTFIHPPPENIILNSMKQNNFGPTGFKNITIKKFYLEFTIL